MKKKKLKCLYIFKLSGSYIGLFVGLIVSLQSRNNRMFLLEGARDFDCGWNPVQNLSCSNLILINILLFLIIGFIVGGIIHKKKL